ncbi:MAG: hypothetical protein ACI81T_003474, partial [Bacteroidia bacterium]
MTSTDNSAKEYPEITDYGYIKDEKVYLKAYLDQEYREIGVVRDGDEVSLQYFVDRFETISKKLDEVAENIQTSDNKGSYLMKLL